MTDRLKENETPATPAAEGAAPESPAAIASTNDGAAAGRATWGTITADSVMVNTGHYEPQVRDDLRWFYAYATETGRKWSMAEAGKQVKCDAATISKIYNDKYRDPKKPSRRIVPEKTIENIRRIRVAAEARASAPGIGAFIETQTSKEIFTTMSAALRNSTVTFIWGDSQIGKTEAILEFKRRNPHGLVKYIRIEPGSGIFDLVRLVARECGISDRGNIGEMKRRIAKCLDKTHLFVVDELHELTFTYQKRSKLSCMEFIRWLHDASGCGLVLCGTNILRDELRNGKDKDLLDQLVRRALTTLDLRLSPTPKDIAAFCNAYDLDKPTGPDAEEVKALVKKRGVKALIYRLSRAKAYAESEKRPVTWTDWMEEHTTLAAYESGEILRD